MQSRYRSTISHLFGLQELANSVPLEGCAEQREKANLEVWDASYIGQATGKYQSVETEIWFGKTV